MTTKDKARLTLFVSPVTLKRMKIEAIKRGVSLSNFVEVVFEAKLKAEREERGKILKKESTK